MRIVLEYVSSTGEVLFCIMIAFLVSQCAALSRSLKTKKHHSNQNDVARINAIFKKLSFQAFRIEKGSVT